MPVSSILVALFSILAYVLWWSKLLCQRGPCGQNWGWPLANSGHAAETVSPAAHKELKPAHDHISELEAEPPRRALRCCFSWCVASETLSYAMPSSWTMKSVRWQIFWASGLWGIFLGSNRQLIYHTKRKVYKSQWYSLMNISPRIAHLVTRTAITNRCDQEMDHHQDPRTRIPTTHTAHILPCHGEFLSWCLTS